MTESKYYLKPNAIEEEHFYNILTALESFKANLDREWVEAHDRGDTAKVNEMSDYSESVLMTIEWFLGATVVRHPEEEFPCLQEELKKKMKLYIEINEEDKISEEGKLCHDYKAMEKLEMQYSMAKESIKQLTKIIRSYLPEYILCYHLNEWYLEKKR